MISICGPTMIPTLALISSYEIHSDDFNRGKKRINVWEFISNESLSHGIRRNPSKCEMKWRNLFRTYKTEKDNKNKT